MTSQDIHIPHLLRYQRDVSDISLPEQFTFPFYYEPHELAIIAASEIQDHITCQSEWEHNFGLHSEVQQGAIGKMFGVLVVKDAEGKLGYLAAFSGKLANSNHHSKFVPPVYDVLDLEGFYKQGEVKVNAINYTIETLQQNEEYKALDEAFKTLTEESKNAIATAKKQNREHKKRRKAIRLQAQKTMSETDYAKLHDAHRTESIKQQHELNRYISDWEQRLVEANKSLAVYADEIARLKQQRKEMSSSLQKQIFDQYQFLNQAGVTRSLVSIFEETYYKTPPAGAGECAAPKLFQYAFTHKLEPVCMAEFWWGAPPPSEVKKHKAFYPSCRGKCEPILGHMLQGIDMEPNPLLTEGSHQPIETLYEDEHIAVINKPEGLLSTPGKHIHDSVATRMKKRYPKATGPLIVHRLDMSTSGILVIAKSLEVYKMLQHQFISHNVSKRYTALLDGVLGTESGIIDLPLRGDFYDRPRQIVCHEHGKHSRTKWETIEVRDGKTLVHFYPISGRTHQLRVHSAHAEGLNCPIVGDDLYGTKGERLCLHSDRITFTHPVTQEEMTVDCTVDFFD